VLYGAALDLIEETPSLQIMATQRAPETKSVSEPQAGLIERTPMPTTTQEWDAYVDAMLFPNGGVIPPAVVERVSRLLVARV
jgi:hypothetical protein